MTQILVRHCYWTSGDDYDKENSSITYCPHCGQYFNDGNKKVSAHIEKEDGSMGLVTICQRCNFSVKYPDKIIFPVPDDSKRYFNVNLNLFHDLKRKSPQWLTYLSEYKENASKIFTDEFIIFGILSVSRKKSPYSLYYIIEIIVASRETRQLFPVSTIVYTKIHIYCVSNKYH